MGVLRLALALGGGAWRIVTAGLRWLAARPRLALLALMTLSCIYLLWQLDRARDAVRDQATRADAAELARDTAQGRAREWQRAHRQLIDRTRAARAQAARADAANVARVSHQFAIRLLSRLSAFLGRFESHFRFG